MVKSLAIHTQRFALLDSQPMPAGRFVYAPREANIGLTRRCNNMCGHCAPASHPKSTEKVTKAMIDKFLLGIEELPIDTMHIEGGEPFLEPDLLRHTLYLTFTSPRLQVVILETSAAWASSLSATEDTLISIPEPADFLIYFAANLDSFHAAVPLSNYINLIKTVFLLYPKARIVFSHTISSGDQTISQFIDLLKKEDLFVSAATDEIDGLTFYSSLTVIWQGQEHNILIDNRHPITVGRGKKLRTNEFLANRNSLTKRTLDLREGQSFLFPERERDTWQILSLGWDGLLYPSAMFMHTGTLPIGDINRDSPSAAIMRAQKDPLLRKLCLGGVGPVYRAFLDTDPRISRLRDERLHAEDLLFDLLADPELTLKTTLRLLQQMDEPSPTVNRSADLAKSIREIFSQDLTGKENRAVREAAEILALAPSKDIIHVFLEGNFQGMDLSLYFTTMMLCEETDRQIGFYKLLVDNDALFNKIFSGSPCTPGNLVFRRQFFRVLAYADQRSLLELIDRAETEKDAKDVVIEVAYELPQSGVVDVFAAVLFALPIERQNSFFQTLGKDRMTEGLVDHLSANYPGQMALVTASPSWH